MYDFLNLSLTMYSLIFTLLFLLFQPIHDQRFQEVDGEWAGSIDVYGQELRISILFTYSDGELDGTLDIPQQHAFHLPLEVIRAEGDEVVFQFETGTGPAIFFGVWDADEESIVGEFEQVGERFPFSLIKKSPAGKDPYSMAETELTIPATSGMIRGSLMIADEQAPLIILLSGSGSQDRNETIAGFGVFRELSRKLFENGYSTFRYDDRGIGGSEGDPDATLQELADDLVEIVSYLNANYNDQFDGIIYLGHSQGGHVATLAAKETDPAAIVMMGVPFLSGDKIINSQIKKIAQFQGISEEILQTNLEFQEEIYQVVRTGSSWEPIEENLKRRLNEQINQLPEAQREALGDMSAFVQSQIDRQLSAAKSRWFRSLIEYEPAEQLGDLNIPVLAVFGSKDMQVVADENMTEAAAIMNRYELDMELHEITNANHLFQHANTGMPTEYGMLDPSFAEGFISTITRWLELLESD